MQDMEDRVMGTGRWAGRPLASYAFKWLSDDLANRVIQQHIEQNWEAVRLSLSRTGRYEALFDVGKMVGEGYYNGSSYTSAARKAVKGETSWVQIRLEVDDASGKPVVITAYPTKKFPERGK